MEMRLNKGIKIIVLFLIAIMIGTGYYVATGSWSNLTNASEARKLPIYCVETNEKKIAISFDAAWGDEFTMGILDTLDQYHARATFFLVGFWIDKYPGDVRIINKRGHEIGSHSLTHPNMTTCTEDKIRQELNVTADKLEELIGTRPTLFRAPFGAYNNTFMEIAEELGYKVIQWDVDSLDWKDLKSEQIVERVVRNSKNGSIVLFHNNAQYVLDYLPAILKKLTDDGYEIVPVGQLIRYDNYYMDHTGKQCELKKIKE